MWPAGIGGQGPLARRPQGVSDSRADTPNTGYIGSPAAEGISYTPAHMLADVPNQFRIEITDLCRCPRAVHPHCHRRGQGTAGGDTGGLRATGRGSEGYYRAGRVDHYRTLRTRRPCAFTRRTTG